MDETAIFEFFKQHLQTHIFSWAENWCESSRQKGDPTLLKSFHSDIKDGHPLNNHLYILQKTPSSKLYVLMSRNLTGCFRPNRDLEMLLSFHPDTKDGHALNSFFWIFQTTSSKPYITLSRNPMEGVWQHWDCEIASDLHIKDCPALNSLNHPICISKIA